MAVVINGNNGISYDDTGIQYYGTDDDLAIYHDGSNSYITNSTGAVIIDGSNPQLKITGDYQTRISLGTDYTDKPHWSITNEANVNRLRIGVADDENDTNFVSTMVITDGGNVGIGQTSPDELLHLKVTSGDAQIKFESSDNTGYHGLVWKDEVGVQQTEFTYGHADNLQTLNVNGNGFRVYSKQTSSTIAYIGGSGGAGGYTNSYFAGNVGIGTNSPDSLLSVALSGSTGTYFEGGGTTNNADARRLLISASTTTFDGDTHTFNAESAGGVLAFATTGTERMRIDNSGNVLVGTTGHLNYSGGTTEITVGTSGTGNTAGGAITFVSNNGATALGYLGFQELQTRVGTMGSRPLVLVTDNTERMRILPGGGLTFNGDTATANALDDYEEGWYYPTLKSGANTAAGDSVSTAYRARYTKIGRNVFVEGYCRFDTSGFSGSWNTTTISLPFTNGGASSEQYCPISISYVSNLGQSIPSGRFIGGYINTSQSYFTITHNNPNGAEYHFTETYLQKSGSLGIMFNCHYSTESIS